jgi:hypothetical protein
MSHIEETYGRGEYQLTAKQFFQLSQVELARFYILNKFTKEELATMRKKRTLGRQQVSRIK